MTLPKGFGGGRSCIKCDEILSYNRLHDEYVCTNTRCTLGRKQESNEIRLPISRWDVIKGIFFTLFYGGITVITVGVVIGSNIGFVFGLLGFIITLITLVITGVEFQYNDYDWKKRKQLFFVFVPLANFLKRIKFDS